MITGVLEGNRNGAANEPRIVELYAVRDIPDLALYGLQIADNGVNSNAPDHCLGCNWNSNSNLNTTFSLQKGQYLLPKFVKSLFFNVIFCIPDMHCGCH